MKQLIVLAFIAISWVGYSQKSKPTPVTSQKSKPSAEASRKIQIKVNGEKDTTVFLIKYYGKNLLYADTAEMKNGLVVFDGKKQIPGIIGLLLPGQRYFEFIYNNEEINLETKGPDFMKNMKINKSVENKIFSDYIAYITAQKVIANEYSFNREKLNKEDPEYTIWSAKIDSVSREVENYQLKLIQSDDNKLVSKIVKLSMDIKIPETPKKEDGTPISTDFAYHYFRDHYFDNLDIKDDRLVNTPIFHNKLDYFFSDKMLMQQPDTIIKFAILFLDKLDQKSEMFKYSLTHITSTFEKSKIMGMDKVFVMMGERYYCSKNSEGKSPAYWMTETKQKELCDKVRINLNLVQGVRPPNVTLRDTTDVVWKDFYSLKSDYTILYFWEPDCGHCKVSTPKLQKLYEEKLKARNVEVFGISKAIGDDFGKWKKFIAKNKLSFINVALTDKLYREATEDARQFVPKFTSLEALNFQDTYDIASTPRLFILDKDKKIIGKGLSISQLEDFMDRVQNIKDAPKVIKEDKESDANEMH
ncbi:MAG: thioredoxin-like domain-containing protein [Crocinitomicaceae bacterium]|nr:thioredoxin-like domain-containing protein [Crocinitomicaceae bacterium]